jgi:hypothetical protein
MIFGTKKKIQLFGKKIKYTIVQIPLSILKWSNEQYDARRHSVDMIF